MPSKSIDNTGVNIRLMDKSTCRRNMDRFKDILKDRRTSSDFMFISREWNPAIAYSHSRKTSPAQLKKNVVNSHRVQLAIEEVSKEGNIPKEKLYKTVEKIVDEIGLDRRTSVIRALGIVLVKVLKRVCRGIYVNEEQIAKVKSLMGSNPVIFAPSHRSYADFILISYICFHYEIAIPAIAAGMDFHSMWLMGRLLRDSCAFFMRRSFANDRLYWTAFSEYVQRLVTENDSSIEFFIEGTRSRTGKSLPPKYGFLTMALTPFLVGRVPDITIVPICISYERTLEEQLFAYELLGVPKPRESTKGLLRALSILRDDYGRVHLDLGEPLSVRQYLGPHLERWRHSLGCPVLESPSDHEAQLCVELAHTIVHRQQRLSVIGPFSLLALALQDGLLRGITPLSLECAISDLAWLRDVLCTLGAQVGIDEGEDLLDVVKDALSVHRSLVELSHDGLRLLRTHVSHSAPSIDRLKGHALCPYTMDLAVPVFMLQHYINPCMHYLVGPAMLVVLLHSGDTISRDELYGRYQFLRSLLSFEFVLYKLWEEEEFTTSLRQLCTLEVACLVEGGTAVRAESCRLRWLLYDLLQPFLVGQMALCRILQCSAAITERDVSRRTQEQLEKEMGLGGHPYSLSLDIYRGTLQSLCSLGVVRKSRRNEHVTYEADKTKLHKVITELAKVINSSPGHCIQLDMFSSKNIMLHQEKFSKL